MRTNVLSGLFSFLLTLGFAVPAFAASEEDEKAETAAEVVQALAEVPESGIPPALLTDAYAVAVIPGVLKIGIFVGGRYGEGLLTVRTAEREWSNPSFITLTGGSFGFQFGAQSTDIILVFKTKRSVDNIVNGKVTLGVDAGIAAGPVGRRAEAATDAQLRAEIYSYSRSRGIFAGVSLDGAAIQIDGDANADYYNKEDITAQEIFTDTKLGRPASARHFIQILNRYTPKPDAPQNNAPAEPSRSGSDLDSFKAESPGPESPEPQQLKSETESGD
jgi:lipid-binding SYLF domain-containing protein